jgi:hypothetical protein
MVRDHRLRIVQDEPERRGPSGAFIWWALGLVAAFGLLCLVCGCKTIEIPYLPDIPWPGTAATNDAGTVTTTTTTTTTTQPPADSGDATDFGKLPFNRGAFDGRKAKRDDRVTLTTADIRGSTLYYAGTGLTVWKVEKENINAVACVFFDEDGDGVYERGGKFDRARSNAQARPMAEHLGGNPPYKNWDGLPKSGTPFAYVIVDLAEGGNKRSNVICGTVGGIVK